MNNLDNEFDQLGLHSISTPGTSPNQATKPKVEVPQLNPDKEKIFLDQSSLKFDESILSNS
jgi:hypothetical protein